MAKKAFIIVDVQNDFCEGGSLAVQGGAQVATNIANYLTEHGSEFDSIITTQDWHIDPGAHFATEPDFVDSWPAHCVANTEGADFHPNLRPVLNGFNIDRFFKGRYEAAYSGFEGFSLDGETMEEFLNYNEIEELVIVGIATDYCVNATVVHALEARFDVTVLADCIAGINPEKVASTLTEWKAQNVKLV